MGTMRTLSEIVYYLALSIAALGSVLVYLWNSSLERAKWAASLYDQFFLKGELKVVRDVIDSTADSDEVIRLVVEERADFTDYLNFFEYVGYLINCRQLRREDVETLFGYYLDCLGRHRCVCDYLTNLSKGYEELAQLVLRRSPP